MCTFKIKQTQYLLSINFIRQPVRMAKRPAPPLEVPREIPSRSRRQASKEALKQMQLLLDDENDAVEIASDDDVSYFLMNIYFFPLF